MPQSLDPEQARDFSYKIALLSKHHPLSVTSWIRTRRRNTAVGGAANSAHLYGLAVDVVLDEPLHNDRLMADAQKLGLVAIDEGDHVHLHEKTKPSSSNTTV